MKKLIAAALATTALTTSAFAGGHSISEFRIGILGGENAQDRMNNNECLREKTEELLGVETKLFGERGTRVRSVLGDTTTTIIALCMRCV